jgi:tRNA threonylcarbamoyladenosine biosynthesis protein TsaB
MIVLGFDTSTSATAVAVRLTDGTATQARDDPPAGARPGHATRLLDMSHQLLAGAGVAWNQIDRIAVGLGPGTFTGLRVGVATARGLAQSLDVELVGISSLQTLAAAALGDEADAVLAVIDARRGEVFAAAYELAEQGLVHQLAPPRPLPPQQLQSVIGEAHETLGAPGAGPRRWLAVGDGAVRFRGEIQDAGLPIAPVDSPLHLVSAACLCALGAQAQATSSQATSSQTIVPDYCRRPDAELALGGVETAGSALT